MLYPVLVHYPVVDREGREITAAVTNLDIHDLARMAVTYTTGAVWIVTPLAAQRQLVGEIIRHWTVGRGGRVNPDRRAALMKIRVAADLEEVAAVLEREENRPVYQVATSAAAGETVTSYRRLRRLLAGGPGSYLLLFGTAWGLSRRLLAAADYRLPPIRPAAVYNHLPVRAAAAIVLDRLLAPAERGWLPTGRPDYELQANEEEHSYSIVEGEQENESDPTD
ncbi:MAG: RNA methyltransferase [Deltaproteobacteria bacterium]|nr:RNA methyltransferase [Deltaproteobacteria bacterium]